MASDKLILRGEYVRDNLRMLDRMEMDTNKPANVLQAVQAKIVPLEYVLAMLAACILFIGKRKGTEFTREIIDEVFRDLRKAGAEAERGYDRIINDIMKEAATKKVGE